LIFAKHFLLIASSAEVLVMISTVSVSPESLNNSKTKKKGEDQPVSRGEARMCKPQLFHGPLL
jgi:hypothetical protein